jgi:glycerophosphoryl diester phosphodiesterase
MKQWTLLLLAALCLVSCERVLYVQDRPISFTNTVLLAHAGGGWHDEPNSMEGCRYGLSTLGGIECDIQRSRDNDLWLSHSELIMPCDSSAALTFASTRSSTILAIDSCYGVQKDFARLDSVFSLMATHYPDKFISLDVKPWLPDDLSGLNLFVEMNELARAIIFLTSSYHLENKVMVESEVADFLLYLRNNSDIETYLTSYGDFELGVSKALKYGFSGISFKYKFKEEITAEQIALMHQKGLKIHIWTVNDTETIQVALLLGVDYIQTDNVESAQEFE